MAVELHKSLDDRKGAWENEKERAIKTVLATFKKSEAFDDITSEYFISGFKILCYKVLREHPTLDLSMFLADEESDSVGLEVETANAAPKKDGAAS